MLATTVSFHKLKFCDRSSHGSTGIAKMSDRKTSIIAWLSNLFESVCDKMLMKEEFHLPCFILWNDINNDLNGYLRERNFPILSKTSFIKIKHDIMFLCLPFFRLEKTFFQM